MIQLGMLREGFMITRAVHDRYDGRLRTGLTPTKTASWGYSGNPFGDDECGKFYARAMSVWSILLACQGFIYDGPAACIGFKPVWQPENHVSFFTGADGYGLFRQRRENGQQVAEIELKRGQLEVREMVFELPNNIEPKGVVVHLDEQELTANVSHDSELRLVLAEPIHLAPNQVLRVRATWQD